MTPKEFWALLPEDKSAEDQMTPEILEEMMSDPRWRHSSMN